MGWVARVVERLDQVKPAWLLLPNGVLALWVLLAHGGALLLVRLGKIPARDFGSSLETAYITLPVAATLFLVTLLAWAWPACRTWVLKLQAVALLCLAIDVLYFAVDVLAHGIPASGNFTWNPVLFAFVLAYALYLARRTLLPNAALQNPVLRYIHVFAPVASIPISILIFWRMDSSVSAPFGFGENIVVLAPTPLVLSKTPLVLTTNERMTVLGESTSVCLVMRDSVPATALSNMDTLASEMHGSNVRVLVQTSDGLQKQLTPPLMGWRSSGVILSRNELSACASASCDARLPKGSVVKRIEISSDSELLVKGVYWESTPDFGKPTESQRSSRRQRPQAAVETLLDCIPCLGVGRAACLVRRPSASATIDCLQRVDGRHSCRCESEWRRRCLMAEM